VQLAFDEIRLAGSSSPQVSRRLTAALDDLLTVVPAERRAPLETQRMLLNEVASAAASTEADRAAALVSDPSGIGSAAPMMDPSLEEPARLI